MPYNKFAERLSNDHKSSFTPVPGAGLVFDGKLIPDDHFGHFFLTYVGNPDACVAFQLEKPKCGFLLIASRKHQAG
jgi:hypothetical protein